MISLAPRRAAVPTPFPHCTLERPGAACHASICARHGLAGTHRLRRDRQIVPFPQLDTRQASENTEDVFHHHVGSALRSQSS
jgi:hypothetical protein